MFKETPLQESSSWCAFLESWDWRNAIVAATKTVVNSSGVSIALLTGVQTVRKLRQVS